MSVIYEPSGFNIPPVLKEFAHWVLWTVADGKKLPFAPWERGDLYPVKWGADAAVRPETDWETAFRYWQHRESYAAPDSVTPEQVLPGPLLLHDPLDPPLMLVDFDDVRDPESGAVSDEAVDIVNRLGGFCEISQSGTGLHVLVRAELPGGLGKFIESLNDIGDIEMYDHGRIIGTTWRHVEGTPSDAIPECQDVVDELIKEYESQETRKRRVQTQPNSNFSGGGASPSGGHDNDSSGDRSPYFDIDIRNVADTGVFKQHRDGWDGPHPEHGPQHSELADCTNFGIEPHSDHWFCFAHNSGGRAIELAAVMCDAVDIDCDAVPRNAGSEGWLRENPEALLKTCLYLREEGVVDDDAAAPYDALVAVAELEDLHIQNRDDGILGDANKQVAAAIFDELTLSDVV